MELLWRGVKGIASVMERSEWTTSTDMATTMWATLRVDGFKPPFSCGGNLSVLTAMAFELYKKTTEVLVNLAGLEILAMAYKSASKGRGGGPIVDLIEAFT